MLHNRPTTLVSLECTGSHQRNCTSLVLTHCMVLVSAVFLTFMLAEFTETRYHFQKCMNTKQLLVVSEY